MKTNRVIKIIGTIDEDAYRHFSDELDSLEQESCAPILVELTSEGGLAYEALAFCSRMRQSKCRLTVRVYGYAMSAATLMLACAAVREITRESWVMVHEDSDKMSGNVVELEKNAAQLRRLETQWTDMLAAKTKTTASMWTTLHKRTTYLNAQQCLELGLVDKII